MENCSRPNSGTVSRIQLKLSCGWSFQVHTWKLTSGRPLSSKAQSGCHGNTGCLAMVRKILRFMTILTTYCSISNISNWCAFITRLVWRDRYCVTWYTHKVPGLSFH